MAAVTSRKRKGWRSRERERATESQNMFRMMISVEQRSENRLQEIEKNDVMYFTRKSQVDSQI